MSVCRRRECISPEMRLPLDGVVAAAATDTVGVLPGEIEVGIPMIGYKPNDNGRHLFRPIVVRPRIITCMGFTLSYYRIGVRLTISVPNSYHFDLRRIISIPVAVYHRYPHYINIIIRVQCQTRRRGCS